MKITMSDSLRLPPSRAKEPGARSVKKRQKDGRVACSQGITYTYNFIYVYRPLGMYICVYIVVIVIIHIYI